jgi:hypothetical protein
MKTGTVLLFGLIASAVGVSAAMAAKPSNMLVDETWRATFSVNPPLEADDTLFQNIVHSAHFPGFEIVDAQRTTTQLILTVRPTVATGIPPTGKNVSFGGYTLTLVSIEKV